MIAVLRRMVDSPPVGLSEIARGAGVNPPTCLGILNELCDAGFVERHDPGPRYSLGTELVLLGQAASRATPGLRLARETINALAAEYRCTCSAATVNGNEIVVVADASPDDAESAGGDVRRDPASGDALHGHDDAGDGAENGLATEGFRYPFFAPIGIMFAAWETDATVRDWLARGIIGPDDERRERAWQIVETCRNQGWLAERLTERERDLHQLLPRLLAGANDHVARLALTRAATIFTSRDLVAGEIEPDKAYGVSMICAPTFNGNGEPDLILSVSLMTPSISGSTIHTIGDRLRASCDAITAAVGGMDPFAGRHST